DDLVTGVQTCALPILAADHAGVVGRGRRPRHTTVGGRAHLEAIARPVVVPLRVAVPVEGARRRVVADDPVLVEVAAGRRDGRVGDRKSVGYGTVGGGG